MKQLFFIALGFLTINTLMCLETLYSTKSSPSCLFSGCKCITNGDNSLDILCIANEVDNNFPIRLNQKSTVAVINTFLIKRYKFKEIPDDTFENLEVRNLIIGENQLEKLTINAFRSIKSLNLLRIIEKNLHTIEPDAFKWVKNCLVEFGLWQLNFKSKDIDLFFEQLATLDHLKSLNLMGYYLTEFKPEWTRVFTNITTLSLASNDIKELNSDLFVLANNLQTLDLSNNFLSNLSNVFEALKPIEMNLRELKLYGNSIEHILDFPELPSLQSLDLSNNKIKVIYGSSFYNLVKLTNLYISNNLINKIEINSFDRLSLMNILLLNNNYLTQTPSISHMNQLKIFDMSNQNGNLRIIHNFAFERQGKLQNAVSINLDLNEIERFGEKSFCNRYSNTSEISNLDVSYPTAKRLDKCLLKQLNSLLSSRVSLNIGLYLQSFNESSELCNCDFKKFVSQYKIDLIGGCSLLSESCDKNKASFAINICQHKTQFDCNVVIN